MTTWPWLTVLLVLVLAVVVAGAAMMLVFGGGPWMMGGGGGWGPSWGPAGTGSWGWMVLGGLIMTVLLLALLAVALSAVLRAGGRGGVPAAPPVPEDPLAVARLRYAKGELSPEQFQRIASDLASPR